MNSASESGGFPRTRPIGRRELDGIGLFDTVNATSGSHAIPSHQRDAPAWYRQLVRKRASMREAWGPHRRLACIPRVACTIPAMTIDEMLSLRPTSVVGMTVLATVSLIDHLACARLWARLLTIEWE